MSDPRYDHGFDRDRIERPYDNDGTGLFTGLAVVGLLILGGLFFYYYSENNTNVAMNSPPANSTISQPAAPGPAMTPSAPVTPSPAPSQNAPAPGGTAQ
jgi:hypothetical protein